VARWTSAPAGGTHGRECQEAQEAEAPGDRAAEGEQPDAVDDEVRPAAVQRRVGDERPRIRRDAAGKHEALQQVGAVADRKEGEQQQDLGVLLGVQHHRAQQVDDDERRGETRHRPRHVQNRLAGRPPCFVHFIRSAASPRW
jgi:hypothetical protein